jgi:hypothetical protein
MKGFILATLWTVVYLVMITFVFRLFHVRSRAGIMTRLYLILVPLYLASHLLTPPDLWFLPEVLTERFQVVDLAFGLLLFVAAFFGGVLQLYNLADRGFSLRIVIDVDDHGGLTLDDVLTGYSAGKGINWMYQKRLDHMSENGFTQMEQGWICNRERGRKTASLFGWLRDFLNLDADRTETPTC